MELVILDPSLRSALIHRRRRLGLGRFDEVWDGVYVMSPLADDEHQAVGTKLSSCFEVAIGTPGVGEVHAGRNMSDRIEGWNQDYRCPDVVVDLTGTSDRLHRTRWVGGPDFAVEVVSRYNRTRQKFDFYAEVGTREVLVVDRYPWELE